MKNLILIGFMGSGKTEVAQALSNQSNLPHIDTDSLIESQTGAPISDLFKTKGESHFRALETQVLNTLPKENTIISSGGGLPITPENHTILQALGHIIYLKTTLETIKNRLDHTENKRPLWNDTIEATYQTRLPIYDALATFTLETDNKNPIELAKEIWTRYND